MFMYLVCNGTCSQSFPGRMSSSDLSGLVQRQPLCWHTEILCYHQRKDGKDESKKEQSKEEQEACSSVISVGYGSRHSHPYQNCWGDT